MSVYHHNWSSMESMCRDFSIETSELDGYEVLYAAYTYEDYSGSAFVLLRDRNGQLYEVNGGHCSCNGLEGQWDMEPTSLAALEKRSYDLVKEAVDILTGSGEANTIETR